MATGFGYKKYLNNQLDEMPSSRGPSPYTQEGYNRTGFPTLGDFYKPIESKTYGAEQDRYSLDLKENSLNMPEYQGNVFSKVMGKLSDLGKWGVNTPVGRGAMWLGTQMDRIPNAVEGMLEKPRDAALASPNGISSLESLKQGAIGFKEGILHEKDYNMGRYLEKLAPNNTAWQDVMRARPIRLAKGLLSSKDNFENQTTDAMRGMSGPGQSPEYAGFSNMTNADILGLMFNLKASVAPLKLGRVKVPGTMEKVTETIKRAPQSFRVARTIGGASEGATAGKSVLGQQILTDVLGKSGPTIGPGGYVPRVTSLVDAKAALKGAVGIEKGLGGSRNLQQAFFAAEDELRNLKLYGGSAEDIAAATKKLEQITPLHEQALEAAGNVWNSKRNVIHTLDDMPFAKRVKPFDFTPTTTTRMVPKGDPALSRYLQFDGVVGDIAQSMGLKQGIPFRGAQDAFKASLGQGARKALSYSPGTERFLSHFTNRIESTATQGASKAFDVIDDSRQGTRMSISHQASRMRQAMNQYLGAGAKLTDNENKVLYYATTMGKDLADPKFLAEINNTFKIPMNELTQMTRLEPLRQWWLGEAGRYASAGEKAGFFKAMDADYMPIFTKKEFNPALHVDDMASFGQEFSGLRSMQKSRNAEYLKDLINRGGRGELAIDTFTGATDRYARTFSNLQRRRNILGGLENLGLVSREAKDGFKPLSSVLDVNPNATIGAQDYFMNERYMPRFRDEIFGYGGGGGLIEGLKGLSRLQNPWKAAVTFFSPKYHTGNMKDDFVRNFLLGDVQAEDMAAAVSRGTSKPYVQGVTVQDWVKQDVQGLSQWMYRPGARNVYDLTARESSDLGRAMGISTVQTTDEVTRSAGGAIGKGFNTVKDRAEQVQGVFREANFMSGLKRQGNSNLAREIVNQDLINYRDISPFTRDVIRPFVPFATFRMKNPGVALNQLAMNPSYFGWLAQAQKALQKDDENLNLPSYYRDKPVLSWNDAGGKLQVFDTGLSQFDSHFLIPGARQMDQARRMPGPLVQLALGAMTGKDALGNQISGPKESNWIDSLLFGKKGADGKTYSPGEYKFILDTLTGEVGDYNVNDPLGPQVSAKFGQVKTFDAKAQALKILLEQNRIRNERLGIYTDTGTYIPPTSELKKAKFRLR